MTYSFDLLLFILSEKEEKLKRLEETWLQILSSTPMFTLLISFDFFSFFKWLSLVSWFPGVGATVVTKKVSFRRFSYHLLSLTYVVAFLIYIN